jgi:hypothetical protein
MTQKAKREMSHQNRDQMKMMGHRNKLRRKWNNQKCWNWPNLVCLLGPIENSTLNVVRADVARKPSKFTYTWNKKYWKYSGYFYAFSICFPQFQLESPRFIHIRVPKIHVSEEAYKFVVALDRLIGQLPVKAPANPPPAGSRKVPTKLVNMWHPFHWAYIYFLNTIFHWKTINTKNAY